MVIRRTILVATSNPHKLREILQVMDDLPVRWGTLADHDPMPEPVEDAQTFQGNAVKKALHYAAHTGAWTLADDSGLEVDAIGGAPGVHSARYAGPEQDATANNAKLVAALRGIPLARRTARFRCEVALAAPDRVLATASGTIEGLILDEARGRHGFGYDPHFLVPAEGLTTAEMDPEQKNRLSHRGQALRALRPKLQALLTA